MALHRGIQSAIFYYLSCAPCAETRYRKKRKQEAVRSRADRDALEQELPNLYRHPSPSSTNPHWQSEIAAGPTLVSRGRKGKTHTSDSRRGLNSGRISSNGSGEQSPVDLPPGTPSDDRDGSRWNFRHYQREDEALWGSRSNLDGSSYAESLTRPQRARTKESATSNYKAFRNPQINDLHPATVTKINSREEVMWMMQPPPVAEVMSGKERALRSRSDSGGSRMSPVSTTTCGPQVPNRAMQTRSKAGSASTVPMSRASSSHSGSVPGQQYDRSTPISERDFAIDLVPKESREKRRPTPVLISKNSDESGLTVVHHPALAPEPFRKPQPSRVASRPQLSTIASDNDLAAVDQDADLSSAEKENGFPTPRQSSEGSARDRNQYARHSAILVSELSPGSMHGRIIRTATTPEIRESPLRLPNHKHEDSDAVALAVRPELFDSWYTPDFELPKWVHEHTKREVRERWSMDL